VKLVASKDERLVEKTADRLDLKWVVTWVEKMVVEKVEQWAVS
jgi:hypothetical protein